MANSSNWVKKFFENALNFQKKKKKESVNKKQNKTENKFGLLHLKSTHPLWKI